MKNKFNFIFRINMASCPHFANSPVLTLVLLFAFLFLQNITSSAQLIVYESFNYTLGATAPDPDGGNPATGLPYTNVGGTPSGTGIGLSVHYGSDNTVVAGLTYNNSGGTLVTSANALKRTSGTGYSTSVKIYNSMTTDPFATYRATSDALTFGWNGSTQKELYFSVLVNVNAVSNSTDRAGLSIWGDGTNNQTGIAQFSNKWYYYHQGAANPFEIGTPVANQTEFVVGRYTFMSATQTKIDIWFNPTLGASLGTPTCTYTTSDKDFRFWSIQTRFGSGVFTYDEFRMGVTAADVMPCHVTVSGT